MLAGGPASLPIKMASIIELSLGSAIGALTFPGSVIAFLKLNGNTQTEETLNVNTLKLERDSAQPR